MSITIGANIVVGLQFMRKRYGLGAVEGGVAEEDGNPSPAILFQVEFPVF